jgi:hypothetical protein
MFFLCEKNNNTDNNKEEEARDTYYFDKGIGNEESNK